MSETFNDYCDKMGGCHRCQAADHRCTDIWNHQQQKIDKLKAQLKAAEKVIGFYGDRENWGYNARMSMELSTEKEHIDAYTSIQDDKTFSVDDQGDNMASHIYIQHHGGKRAQEYMTKYKAIK